MGNYREILGQKTGLRLWSNVLAFWGVWVLRGIREVVCWIWMAVWVGVFSSWWSLMDCFGLPF